jgi:hypothetical protein
MKDEEQRFLFAALAMLGGVIRHGAMHKFVAIDAWAMADEMLAARDGEEELGITAIKPKRKPRTTE